MWWTHQRSNLQTFRECSQKAASFYGPFSLLVELFPGISTPLPRRKMLLPPSMTSYLDLMWSMKCVQNRHESFPSRRVKSHVSSFCQGNVPDCGCSSSPGPRENRHGAQPWLALMDTLDERDMKIFCCQVTELLGSLSDTAQPSSS